jgi:hypothetical protein
MKKTKSTQQGLQRTSNASEYVTNGELYQVFPNKVKICQINLPQGIEFAKREKVLYSIGLQYLSLNQDMSEDMLYSYISSINKAPHINVPLSSQSLIKIVNNIFKKKDKEGELKVIPNKERTVIFDDIKFNITHKQKITIVNKENGLLKQERTKQKIYEAIEDWSGSTKITTAGIAESTGLSLRTVKTYWPEFKSYVADLNKDLKSIKKDKSIPTIEVEKKVSEIEEKPLKNESNQDLSPLYIKYKTKWDRERHRFDHSDLCTLDSKYNEENSGVKKYNFRVFVQTLRLEFDLSFEDFLIKCDNLINK